MLGIYDVYKGGPETALEQAVQVPVNDPLMVIPAMVVGSGTLNDLANSELGRPSPPCHRP